MASFGRVVPVYNNGGNNVKAYPKIAADTCRMYIGPITVRQIMVSS